MSCSVLPSKAACSVLGACAELSSQLQTVHQCAPYAREPHRGQPQCSAKVRGLLWPHGAAYHLSWTLASSQRMWHPQTGLCSQPGKQLFHNIATSVTDSLKCMLFGKHVLIGNNSSPTYSLTAMIYFYKFLTINKWKPSNGNVFDDLLTSFPSWVLFSSATLPASEIAATRRGCVTATMPWRPMPASYRYWGIWVVFPEPVSPDGHWIYKRGFSGQQPDNSVSLNCC